MRDQLDLEATPQTTARRRRRWLGGLSLTAGLATVAAVALGGPLTTPHAVEPLPAAAPAGVCGGVAGCKVVDQTDVDGDGRTDAVGIVPQGLDQVDEPGSVTVRVRTATDRLLTSTSRGVWWYGKPAEVYSGSAAIDDRRGAELVLGQAMGAHTLLYRVLTYRDGNLTTLQSPKAPKRTGQSRDIDTWTVDGSFSFQVGIKRSTSRGRVYVTVTSAERSTSGSSHSGWAVRYRRTSDGWKEVSTKRVWYGTDEEASKVGGWHVKGLPRFS